MHLHLCQDDPLQDTLRINVPHASVVRYPEARITPLSVFGRRGNDDLLYLGTLENLFDEPPPVPEGFIHSDDRMADLSGKRSTSVKFSTGLDILGGFLQGLGVPSAGIEAGFEHTSEIAFSFSNVVRFYVEPLQLDRLVRSRVVSDPEPFVGDDAYELLIVDSTITSTDLSVHAGSTTDTKASIKLPVIQQIVQDAHASVEVTSASSTDLTFKGTRPLAFAFTAFQFAVGARGRVGTGDTAFLLPGAEPDEPPEHVEIAPPSLMLEWKDAKSVARVG